MYLEKILNFDISHARLKTTSPISINNREIQQYEFDVKRMIKSRPIFAGNTQKPFEIFFA